jgi:GR25 family glycosyltransferase involved in LPS biosynthesis
MAVKVPERGLRIQPFYKTTGVDNSDCWHFFDKIYCISIAQRIDRREEAKRQFAQVGLAERVEFVIVHKHPLNPEQGIYESHLLCLRQGLAVGASRILIFEDDILLHGVKPEPLRRALHALATDREWDLFVLGALVSHSHKSGDPGLLKIKFSALTHAYACNRPFAESLIQTPWSGMPYDLFLRHAQKNAYALYPAVAFQSNASTDNQLLHLERFRRICGGLARIQKMNELYHRHQTMVILSHLLALGVLLLFIWP